MSLLIKKGKLDHKNGFKGLGQPPKAYMDLPVSGNAQELCLFLSTSNTSPNIANPVSETYAQELRCG